MNKKITSDMKNFFYNLTLNFIPARLTTAISGILSFMVGGKVKETFFSYYLIFIILIYLVSY